MPGFDAVGDSGENIAPLSEPAAGFLEDIFGLFVVAKGAGLGAEGAGGGAVDIAGAERPKSEERLNRGEHRPNEDNNDDDREKFDEDGKRLDEMRVLEDDLFEEGILDIIFEISITLLEADFFRDTAEGLFENLEIGATDFSLENRENRDKDAGEPENDKGSNANHVFILS